MIRFMTGFVTGLMMDISFELDNKLVRTILIDPDRSRDAIASKNASESFFASQCVSKSFEILVCRGVLC